jgi:hypothetical protein
MLKSYNRSIISEYPFRFCILPIVKVTAGNRFSDRLLMLDSLNTIIIKLDDFIPSSNFLLIESPREISYLSCQTDISSLVVFQLTNPQKIYLYKFRHF